MGAAFKYQTYSADNFKVFAKTYTTSGDFMKTGMENSSAVNKTWQTILSRGYKMQKDGACRFVMQLTMAESSSWVDYGAAQNISLEYSIPGKAGALMDISLVWTNKTSSRLAESFWLSFVPEAGA